MNNGDKPAYPIVDQHGSVTHVSQCGLDIPVNWASGLTKRERFAMAAMQGIISQGQINPDDSEKGLTLGEVVGRRAAVFADDTLAALGQE